MYRPWQKQKLSGLLAYGFTPTLDKMHLPDQANTIIL
jgi:hypothetical protein